MRALSCLSFALVITIAGCGTPTAAPCGGRCSSTQICLADACMALSCPTCADADHDGVPACGPAVGVCDCNDAEPRIHPTAEDVCGNGIDEDCSGEPGGMGALCDGDGDGFSSDLDCDDTDPLVHPGDLSLEACNDVDDNCNGLVDERAGCRTADLDGDGADACAPGATDCATCDCNDCDSGIHPAAHEACGDAIDEDGVGGDLMCAAGDTDRDGYTGGQDCMEGDPQVHFDAPENCSTPASESCGAATCSGSDIDVDGDGYGAIASGGSDCDDLHATIHPNATELCNGVDDDCDGDADEVLDPANHFGCALDPTCASGSRCTVDFAASLHHCGGCRQECNPGATLVADQCVAGACACSANSAGAGAACSLGSTCCAADARGLPVPFPGCFDLARSTQNCGACGNACDPMLADSCVAGACGCGTHPACAAPLACIAGACTMAM